MFKERILSKKIQQLNLLKGALIERSEDSKEVLVEKIEETLEDIELILKDFEYTSKEEEY
jgi:hypothetical protein